MTVVLIMPEMIRAMGQGLGSQSVVFVNLGRPESLFRRL
jgi:hypothetical protein